jgi:DNA-binding NarL/FixJ family response regulator
MRAEPPTAIIRAEALRESVFAATMLKSVLIADDHKIMREALRSLLAKNRTFTCVAEVDDGLQAVQAAKDLQPDIVIMDLIMPKLNGIEATARIKAELPKTAVVVLSFHAPRAHVTQALHAGATAYLLKDAAFEELLTALKVVARGGVYVSADVARSAGLGAEIAGSLVDNLATSHRLTKREMEVLQLIGNGIPTKEIAAKLQISVKTVETHRKQIMDKLGIRTVAGLTKYCIREGLISL